MQTLLELEMILSKKFIICAQLGVRGEMMLAMVILCLFPEIATWSPNQMMGGAE